MKGYKRHLLLTFFLMAAMQGIMTGQVTLQRFKVENASDRPPVASDYHVGESLFNHVKGEANGKTAEELRNLINCDYYNQSYISAKTAVTYWTKVNVDVNGNVSIYNLLNKGTTIKGTLNSATATITVPVQKLFSEDEYGDFYCVNVDIASKAYYPDRDLEIAIADDGTLSLGNWGAFVLTGSYKGYSTIRYAEVMTPARAQITDYSLTRTPKINTYPAVYVRENNHRALVTNFYNYGADVVIDISANGTASISRSALAYGTNASGSTITYYNYPVSNYVSPTSYKLTSAATSATFSGDSIVTGMWALSTNTTISNVFDLLEKTVIKVPETFATYSNDLNLKGSGTTDDPYLISSAEDLVNLSDAVNYSGKYVTSKKCFTGSYFKQTADIDMAKMPNFEPIGNTTSVTFNGKYDGGNHSISNLTINRRAIAYGGLFGILESDGSISNLTFENPKVTSTANYLAIVAGMSKGVINDITIKGASLEGTNYTSGIAGSFAGSMSRCSFDGDILGQNYTGGLAGMGWGQMSDCESSARITTGRTGCIIGGLAGSLAGDTLVVSNCRFTGSITDKNGSGTLGGLAGYFQNGKTIRSASTGHIYSNSVATNTTVIGGLLGLLANATLEDCSMSGQIISPDAPTVGGLVGKVTKRSGSGTDTPIIRHCLVNGVIQASPSLKGIEFVSADTVTYLEIKDCVFDNIVSSCSGNIDSGLATSVLTSGQTIPALNTSSWTFKQNHYPAITAIGSSDAGKLQSAAAILSEGDLPASVQKSIALTGDVEWYLLADGKFSKTGHGLTISGNTASMSAEAVTSDTLAAVSGSAARYLYLKVLPKEYEGEGTAENPFLIKTKNDIYRLHNAVDVNGVRYTGLHFKLANDINMGGNRGFIGFSGTGPDKCFNGTFDGDGHSITNWIVDRVELDGTTPTVSGASGLMAGFFLYLGPEGTVKNLNIDGSCSIMAGTHVAAVVSQNYGTVENCRNHASVWGMNNYIGGVVDLNAEGATVRHCYNDATVKCGRSIAGSIVAYNFGKVEMCQNDGEMYNGIISSSYDNINVIGGAGGVVGYNYGSVSDCVNNGTVTSPKQVGGIIGQNKDTGTITRCLNTGVVNTTYNTTNSGALIGNQLNVTDTLQRLYFDRQTSWATACDNKELEGTTPLLTSDLISGKLPEGLDPQIWKCETGKYPVIAKFYDEPTSRFNSQTIVNFMADSRVDSRFYMRREAQITTPSGTSVSMRNNKLKATESKIAFGDSDTAAVDTLVFASGEMKKEIPIFASAKVLPTGNGTAANPWQIRNADEWNYLADFSDNYSLDFEDDNFAITAPLDFAGKSFKRICGTGMVPFQGYLNGNDFSINNISINDTTTSNSYMGLIRALGNKGRISNIIMEAGNSFKAKMYVGSIVGTNAGIIENCINRAPITSYLNYAGGISGFVNAGGKFINCKNEAPILATTGIAGGIAGGSNAEIGGLMKGCENKGAIKGSRIAGGLIGSSRVVLDSCVNYGEITVTEEGYGGGIVGYHTYDMPISNCENHGKVTTKKSQAGGIVGYLFSPASIAKCNNYGEINSGTNYAGGIVGQSYKGNVLISGCTNYGSITTTTTYSGGIAGALAAGTSETDMTIVTDAKNYGPVTATTNYAGGIIGSAPAFSRYYNVENYGNIFGNMYVGGCFGQLLGQADTCINVGNVSAKLYTIGGIIGTTATTTTVTARIDNALNVGKVYSESATASNKYNIGGILGGGNIKMYNCVNFADIEGYKALGGLVGAVAKGAYSSVYKETYYGTCIYNSYSAGSVTCEQGGLEGTAGHIFGTSTANYALDYTEFENLYVDPQQKGKTTFVLDSVASHKVPRELTAALLGDGFTDIESTSCYPMPKALADKGIATLYSSALKLDNDAWTRHNMGGAFHVRAPKGVTWSSDHFDINTAKNIVSWTTLTPGNEYKLYANSDAGTREFTITPANSSNVDDATASLEVISRQYYSLDGLKLQNEPETGVCLIRITYSDGSSLVKRVVK